MATVLEAFEKILNSPKDMAILSTQPIHKSVFMALYSFVKQGGDFADLSWFSLSKPSQTNYNKQFYKNAA